MNDKEPAPAPGFDGTQICRQVDPDLFYPDPQDAVRSLGIAKGLCGSCEFREPCLHWALTTPEQHGIWSGTTEMERKAMRDRLGIPQPPRERSALQVDRARRSQMIREMSAAGVRDEDIAARVGTTARTVTRIRRAAGIADAVGAA